VQTESRLQAKEIIAIPEAIKQIFFIESLIIGWDILLT